MKNFPSLRHRLALALVEDGAFNDVTTGPLIRSRSKKLKAVFWCRQPGVFSGGAVIREVFGLLDRNSKVSSVEKDGARVKKGSKLAQVEAKADALLAGERLVLNLLCQLGGIASLTRKFVDAVRGTGARIVDTRKITPLWRDLVRQAVVAGGGVNHRNSLADAVLVKDNHWALAAQSGQRISEVFGPAARRVLRPRPDFVCIEAETHAQVWEAIKARADIILLDNMAENQLKEAIVFIKAARRALKTETPRIEVSGGVDLGNVRRLAELGADRISIGSLTHSAPALDISLEVVDGRF